MESVFDLVRHDLEQRDRLGWRQHGKPLLPHDGRDSLWDAYEEALDLCVYLRKAIAERESLQNNPKAPAAHPMPNDAL